MKGFLFILLITFFAPLQCYRSEYFFVMRRDTKEAVCITPYPSSPFPTFDLDKLQISADVGFKYWDWLADWKLQNDTVVRRDEIKVLIAGNQPFHFVTRDHFGVADVYLLASNITLWMANSLKPRGGGMLFELDHLNETTKLKDTTLKYCDQNPEVEGSNCTILDYKNGTNHLNDANRWTKFRTYLKDVLIGVEMIEMSYGKQKPVVQCSWDNAKISSAFYPYRDFIVFAKSHQRNAAFYKSGYSSELDLSNNNEMKRNYTKRSSGKFCVWVTWNKKKSNDSNELMEVRNLASGRVQPPTNTTHGSHWTNFQWNHLDAGEYEFTLRFDKRQPSWYIDLCQDRASMIRRTWLSIPKAITKCQFNVGFASEFPAGPTSPPDPTIKPKWRSKDWKHVCDRLGIGSNDAEVQIKFCDWKGCNFSKCPHLQRDPSYIFDF